MRRVEFFGTEGATSEELEPEKSLLPEQSRIVMVEKNQRRTRRKGVLAMSGRSMRIQAHTARESRHHRGIRRRPAGGE